MVDGTASDATGTGDKPRTRRRAATARLRTETRDLHDRIERNPVAVRLMAPDVTLADHATMHRRLIGYHRPATAWLGRALAGTMPEVVAGMRERVDRLADDLRWLGVDPAMTPDATLSFRTDDAGDALGVAYVLEGSVLGGRIIARHLAGTLGLGPGRGAGFYAGPPDGGHLSWAEVCARIDEAGASLGPGAADAMVAAARLAFAELDRWFSDGGTATPP